MRLCSVSSMLAFAYFCMTLALLQDLVVQGVLVSKPTPQVIYHGGPILSNQPTLDAHIVWYGHFSKPQRSIMEDLLSSMRLSTTPPAESNGAPTVGNWWATMAAYKDHAGTPVSPNVKVAGQVSDRKYSHGKALKTTDIEALVASAADQAAPNQFAIFIILTSADVVVEDFCESECATHAVITLPSGQVVPYIWAGDSTTQCPGQCAWPFALPTYMDYYSSETTKGAPNGDIGMDGIVINIGMILAGAATNPYGNAYYEGNPEVPLEVGTVCTGIFGPGAYPGDPGTLLTDNSTGASYNTVGVNQRRFLLPAVWDPIVQNCKTFA